MTPLTGWENFYAVVGSSAGALIGLKFVVITLISRFFEEAVISMTAALKPDVILLDLHMPDDRSFSPEFVKANLSGARVLAMPLLSDFENEEEV